MAQPANRLDMGTPNTSICAPYWEMEPKPTIRWDNWYETFALSMMVEHDLYIRTIIDHAPKDDKAIGFGDISHPEAANKLKDALFVHLGIEGRSRYNVKIPGDVMLTMDLARLVEQPGRISIMLK